MESSPLYNHMEKADFLYFEVEDPKGINLIMFRGSHVTFSAKMRLKICAFLNNNHFKGSRMGRSAKVSLWCVALLINTRFRFFILE